MPASLVLASLLAVAAPQQTAVLNTLSFPAPVHLVLDGHHYDLPAGGIELRDGDYHVLPTLLLADCARPNDAAQVMTAHTLRWAGGLRTVYLAAPSEDANPASLRYANGEWTIEFTSATGDIRCNGEVMPSGVMFRSGFE